jgi:hypothetical protein
MWELCGVDDYSIYMTLQELIKTRQISYFEAPFVKAGPAIPIQLGTEKQLAVGDQISAIWVDDPSMAPLVRSGKILGSLTEADPAHVIHTIGLPSSASGAPIIKEEVVIGLHCGALPPDSSVGPTEGFHQMVWVESIVECLNQAGEQQIVKKLTMSGEQEITVPGGAAAPPKAKNQGIREVARIQCPKCGRSTLEMTNFCKGCGHRLVKDQAPSKGKVKARPAAVVVAPAAKTKGPPLIWAFVMALIAFIGGLGALALMPQPHVVRSCGVTIPQMPSVQTTVMLFDDSTAKWVDTSPNQIFMPNQKVCIDVLVKRPGYFYCLYKGTSGAIHLIFPGEKLREEMMQIGYKFSIGYDKEHTDKYYLKEFSPFSFDEKFGCEQVLFIASASKLKYLPKEEAYRELVDNCLDLLNRYDSPAGLRTTVEQLGPEFFRRGDAKINGGENDYLKDDVYISLVKLEHGNLSQ